MQRADLLDDARFRTRESRHANRAAMLGLFQEFASTFAFFSDFEAALAKGGLAAGVMQPIAKAADDAWARERDAFVDVGDNRAGALRLPRSPFRFSEGEAGTTGRPAWQGEHNREVLRTLLDLSDDEIDRLHHDGVLVERPV